MPQMKIITLYSFIISSSPGYIGFKLGMFFKLSFIYLLY